MYELFKVLNESQSNEFSLLLLLELVVLFSLVGTPSRDGVMVADESRLAWSRLMDLLYAIVSAFSMCLVRSSELVLW